jgi:glutamate-1-semialdehyde 2,1-aminomutase
MSLKAYLTFMHVTETPIMPPHGLNTEIDAALIAARERYARRNPRSRLLYEDACTVMPGGNTRSTLFYSPFPVVIEAGQGCRIQDADGHEYVDFLGDFTAGLYGHANPLIRAAIDKALDGGINLSGPNSREAALARAICQRFPSIELVRFTNSGTEANLMALATSLVIPGRHKILAFSGAYHGGLLNFSAAAVSTNVPHDFVVGRYNDCADTKRLLDLYGAQLAAILVEPMLGAGGCIPGEPTFLEMLRARATQCGITLIFDEVMTSRMAPGGMQESLGINPDLTTLGKYLGGGLSFGAFGGRGALMNRYDSRRPDALQHAGTFNNNVLSMAAGHAGMTQVFTPAVSRRLNARGDALRHQLNVLCRTHDTILQFTGVGSLMTAHFSSLPVITPDDVAAGDQLLKELFFFDMLERGIYLARRGMIALSLEVRDAECDLFVGAVEEFVKKRRLLLSRHTPTTTRGHHGLGKEEG